MITSIAIVLVIGLVNPTVNALHCYFCEIGDPDCNADGWGREIGCSTDPGSINYGDACMVEHIVKIDGSGNTTIREWQRKCVSKNEFQLGCKKQEGDGPGAYEERCVCDEPLCNGPLNESKTRIPEVPVLRCVYCDENDPGCDAKATNEGIVDCQLDHYDQPHYGNACFVGHTTEEPEKWRRDCKYTSVVNLGCHQHELGLYGKTIVVDECICNIDECNRQMGPIETTSHSPETTTKENELQCYFCLSDDHNYGDCNEEHAGGMVTCQTEDELGRHYGHTCAVVHTVNADYNIWRRDCYTPPDDFVGCKNYDRSNGTMHWDIEICVCKGNLCNEKMGDVPTSSTEKTTTHKANVLDCYYCGHEEDTCSEDIAGPEVQCQMDNPEEDYYGDACYIGHSVHEETKDDHWWRGCKSNVDKMTGCSQHPFTHHGEEYVVDECVCNTPGCNKEMGPIPETTTKAADLMCYYCLSTTGECSEDEYGDLVKCQEDDEHVDHYGNACIIGHTVELEKTYWGRDCVDSTKLDIGCQRQTHNGTDIELCVCKEEGCNKEMGDMSTTSTASTTTNQDPSTIECYYCFGHAGTQHDDCDDDFFGDKITCQMHDRQLPNYGDVCYVGHTEKSDEAGSTTWRRGCEVRGSKHDGCEEYKWQGGNITVMECICASPLCNKDVPQFTTTTQDPNALKCYFCGHADDECSENNYGESVKCQTNDPEAHNYGDACYVGHSVHENVTKEHWWRGCKYANDEPTGCTQHEFYYHDHEIVVDECVCRGDFCNKEMIPVTPPTTPNTGSPKNVANLSMVIFLSAFIIINIIL